MNLGKNKKTNPAVVNGFNTGGARIPGARVVPGKNKQIGKNDVNVAKQTAADKILEKKKESFYTQKFGDINQKFMDEMGRLLTYRQAEGVARMKFPKNNDGNFQLKFN